MNKKLIGTIISIIAFTQSMYAGVTCESGSANDITTTVSIKIDKPFTGISASACLEITYTQDDKSPVAVITGPANIVEGITWDVNSNGLLFFKYPKYTKTMRGKVAIKLNGPLLTSYVASSLSSIKVTTELSTSKFLNFTVSSSASITMQKKVTVINSGVSMAVSSGAMLKFSDALNCDDAKITLSSLGTVNLSSVSAKSINYNGSSTSIFNVDNLKADDFNISESSGAEATIRKCQSKNLAISASSASEVSVSDIITESVSLSCSSAATVTLSGRCKTANITGSSGARIDLKGMNIHNINQNISSGARVKLQ